MLIGALAAAPAAAAVAGRLVAAAEGALKGVEGAAFGTLIERPKLAPPPSRAAEASNVMDTRERPIRRAAKNFSCRSSN